MSRVDQEGRGRQWMPELASERDGHNGDERLTATTPHNHHQRSFSSTPTALIMGLSLYYHSPLP